MRSMIESLPGMRDMRLGQSSGGGTVGISAHWPPASSGRWPRAAFTVRISRSPTWPTARAWVTCLPATAIVTSMSMIDGGLAYERYCAVAHTTGRPGAPLEGGDGRAQPAARRRGTGGRWRSRA